MVFGIAIAIAYWFSSHDVTGTTLLALFASGLAFAAGYMIFVEREADLPGDDAGLRPPDGAGDELGTFTLRSPWPAWLAASIAAFLVGMLVTPALACAGAVAVVVVCWQLVLESR